MPKPAAKKHKKPAVKAVAHPRRKPKPATKSGSKPKPKRKPKMATDRIDNRDQDPNHPANKTPSTARRPGERSYAEGFNVPPEELLTEQEKDAVGSGVSGDTTAGVGPAGPAEHTSGPVETIEDQGIGPRTPYPTGNPPPPDVQTTTAQGVKGVSDKPKNAPDKPLVKEPHK